MKLEYKNVFFEPYVGKFYEKGFNNKHIMVLAHNYPCNEERAVCPDCGDRTQHPECLEQGANISEYLKGEWLGKHKRTFNNFERAIYKKFDITEEDRQLFWNSVVYYNYIQKSGDAKRIGDMDLQLYLDAVKPFEEVLHLLNPKPTHIIVWGKCYEKIPIDRCENSLIVNGKDYNCCEFTIETSAVIKMLRLHHPSMFFSWKNWGEVIEEFLK